jgi:hypothetical protein
MAHRTIGQPIDFDMLPLDQIASDYELFLNLRGPLHVEDLALLPEMEFGMPMALQAPLHGQGLLLPHDGHFIDASVAAYAPDPLLDMDGVVEIDEVG